MKPAKWNPLRDMEDAIQLYGRMLGVPGSMPATGSQETMASGDWAPRVDIAEIPDGFEIKADLPGVGKEDVKVTVENGVLTIQGERKADVQNDNKKLHRVERSAGSFSRSFTLPENINGDNIGAKFNDGVLTVNIPKAEQPKAKALEVPIS